MPTFTLNQAILTAVQRNPTLLNAEQEIKRTKGVIIQVRAQALPQINANANFQWTDPHLTAARILGNTTTTTGFTPSTAAASLMEGLPSQVRDFRGAMAGRADKGIMMTTGTFTVEAKKEARRDGAAPSGPGAR